MKENKVLIAAIAVMTASLLWAIFTTVACVKLDRQKQELKALTAHCQEQWKQCTEGWRHCNEERKVLQNESKAVNFDTTAAKLVIGKTQTSEMHPAGAYHLEDISFLDSKKARYCPIYFTIMGKANLTYNYKNQHIWRINH